MNKQHSGIPDLRHKNLFVFALLLVALEIGGCDYLSMVVLNEVGARPDFTLDAYYDYETEPITVTLDARAATEPNNYQWSELWRIEGDIPYGQFHLYDTTSSWPPSFQGQSLGYCYRVAVVGQTGKNEDGNVQIGIKQRSTPVIAR